ncbi:hypothetical protein WJX77_008537 [Trebouxia sp. C0004]
MRMEKAKVTMQLPWTHWWWQNMRRALDTACVHFTPYFPWPITHALQTASIRSSMMWRLPELERTSRKVKK